MPVRERIHGEWSSTDKSDIDVKLGRCCVIEQPASGW